MAALADEVVAMEDLAEVMHNNMNTLEVRGGRHLPAPCICCCLELSTGCKLSVAPWRSATQLLPTCLHCFLEFRLASAVASGMPPQGSACSLSPGVKLLVPQRFALLQPADWDRQQTGAGSAAVRISYRA